MTQPGIPPNGRLRAIEAIYAKLHDRTDEACRDVHALYHPDVVFRDPIVVTRGLDEFVETLRHFAGAMDAIRFAMHDGFEDASRGFATWTFHVVPKRGPRLAVHGATHVRFRDDLIVWHRDYWDLWGTFADAVPGVAGLYRRILKAFA